MRIPLLRSIFITMLAGSLLFGFLPTIAESEARTYRYDFVITYGEGTHTYFRVEYNFDKKKGRFCWFDDTSNTLKPKVIEEIDKGTPWSSLVDLSTQVHSCFDFVGYQPFNTFHSPGRVLYEGWYSTFFFVGKLTPSLLSGELHEYRIRKDGKIPIHDMNSIRAKSAKSTH